MIGTWLNISLSIQWHYFTDHILTMSRRHYWFKRSKIKGEDPRRKGHSCRFRTRNQPILLTNINYSYDYLMFKCSFIVPIFFSADFLRTIYVLIRNQCQGWNKMCEVWLVSAPQNYCLLYIFWSHKTWLNPLCFFLQFPCISLKKKLALLTSSP